MKGQAIKYSAEEIQWLELNKKLSISEYHKYFLKEFSRDDVKKMHLHALRKRKGWKTGRTGRFEKGHKPHPNARPKGANKTSFKKGRLPHNHKHVGHERINRDGYVEVKTAEPRTFELKHRLVWKEKNGSIPKGMIIWFIDGDRTNCKIENLELISRQEQVLRNKLKVRSADESIQPTLKLVAKIASRAHELSSA